MKKTALVFATLAAFGLNAVSFAQEMKPKPTPKRWYNEPQPRETGLRLGIGPSLPILSGTVGIGGELQLMVQVSEEAAIGLHTGYMRWSDSDGSLSGSLSNIPVLASFLYRFHVSGSSARPFLGLTAGIGILSGTLSSGTDSISGSNVVFNGYARFGIEIDMGTQSAFFIDPKAGLLKSVFIFAPTIGVIFNL